MKRILGVLAVVALVAMTVQAVEVKSQNVAGVYTVTLPAQDGLVALAVSLDPFDAADATLEGVLGTDQLRPDQGKAGEGDKVFIWNPSLGAGGGYDIYFLKDPGGGAQWFHSNSSTYSNPALESGEALWLKSANAELSDLAVSLTGQVVVDQQVDTPISAGLQLISYPFSSEIAVNDTMFIANGAAKDKGKAGEGDKIFIWDPTGGTGAGAYTILLVDDGEDFWKESGASVASDAALPVGQGIWYKAVTGGFTWSETNKYLDNI